MSYCLGIDLGTTNTVASVYRRGQLETIPVEGRSLLPSAVSLRPDGTWLVGQAAKARAYIEPDATVVSSKRDIGVSGIRYGLPGRAVTPVDVAALILAKVKEAAQEALGETDEAVITVPAYFDEAQRQATKAAGEAAGFRVRRILPEPTAAAIAYGVDKGRDQTLLVYDLGGGTFDVSILRVEGNDFRVLAVGGDGHLGGDDFDSLIVDWIVSTAGIGLDALPSRQAQATRQKLRQAAEGAKIALSESSSAEILLPDVAGRPIDLTLTLDEYDSLVEPLVDRTLAVLASTLREGRLGKDDIDRVILVGGSTKNAIVRRKVASALREPYIAPQVDLVVSQGAALVGANLAAPVPGAPPPPIRVTDLTAHTLGTDCVSEGDLIIDAVIPRQTPYPCKRGRLYATQPHQKRVESGVFRGESRRPEECVRLGELPMDIRNPGPRGVPVGVVFELDADGIVHFTCVEMPLDAEALSLLEYAGAHGNELPVDRLESLLARSWGHAEKVSVRS